MKKSFKRKKLVTIIFIPHSQKNSYNLKFPLAFFYFLILLFVGTIVLSGLFLFKFGEFSQIKRANSEFLSEMAKIRKTISTVRGLEARLKTLTGSSQETGIATGGSGLQALMEDRPLEREERSLSELEKGLEGERMREAFLPSISPVENGWIISKSLKVLEVASLPGSVVRATAEGKVLCASRGKVIIDHENGLKTGYENLERVSVKVGERVKKCATIGYSKEKGISYQVGRLDKKIDPFDYMSDWR